MIFSLLEVDITWIESSKETLKNVLNRFSGVTRVYYISHDMYPVVIVKAHNHLLAKF